ncbi:hypothetical protein [Falsibacillus pallidus]|uniref:DUF1453 domain-containing protein n=1 Tax=Falsibacillus pallidus TaxID=493781 RepID=A0A370GPZ4_9BACI|nr:hypothetical protein [Falsibacillus pallidus]RDI45788.1 hypothetical protein DFR59_102422 [Falsibacillus pallidus]
MQNIFQFIVPAAIIGFVLYRRIRRSIGFQLYKQRRLIVRMSIFSILLVLILGLSFSHPINLLYDFLGAAAGSLILMYAIRKSLFEMKEDGLYYRTHIWIESFILFVFLSRFIYRFTNWGSISQAAADAGNNPDQVNIAFTSDPISRAVFFLLAVYYIGFYFYVWKKGKVLLQETESKPTIQI